MFIKKSSITLFLLIIMTTNAHAGFNGLTYHSRANCGNNESITWDFTRSWDLYTISNHYRNGKLQHGVRTNWQNTKRSAGVCWAEAAPGSGWYVEGAHWIMLGKKETLINMTKVNDCSIYDGWWDW